MKEDQSVSMNSEQMQELAAFYIKRTSERIGGALFVMGTCVALLMGLFGYGESALAAALAFGVSSMVAAFYPLFTQ